MRAIILTEVGKKIGFGHLNRCLSIETELKKHGIESDFVVNCKHVGKDLLRANFLVFDWLRNRKKLYHLLKKSHFAIIDSYLAPLSLYQYISGNIILSLYLDDNNRLTYPKGIVVNGNAYASHLPYPRNKNQYLLGTKFTPLRAEFNQIDRKQIREKIMDILITFGGSDVKNMTPRILKSICHFYPEVNKKVLIGGGFKNIAEIRSNADPKTQLVFSPTGTRLKNFMQNSDIAISAGGQTIYELLRVGVPTIATAVADNQILNVESLEKKKILLNLERWKDERIEDRIAALMTRLKNQGLRKKMSQLGRKIIDGKGAERIVNVLLKCFIRESVILRKARPADMLGIFSLTNESSVRRASFQQKVISLDDHKKWFEEKVSDSSCLFFVVEFEKKIIGQLRLDIESHTALISISVAQKFNGMGVGGLLMGYAVNYIRSHQIQISRIIARIKTDNIASRNFFEKSGFKRKRHLQTNTQKIDEYFYTI